MDFEKDLDKLDDNALSSISELGRSVSSNEFEIDLLEKALKKKKEEQKKPVMTKKKIYKKCPAQKFSGAV